MYFWIISGIIPPLLWSIVNHIDKYLLSRAKHLSSVSVLMVYSTGFSLVIIPILFYFVGYKELFVGYRQIIIQIIGGFLIASSIYFYLLALFKEEVSRVIPLALLVPVFGYSFSYFLLGEILTGKELFACLLIILGALILSLEFKKESKKLNIKHGALLLMIGCSAFQAAQETLFKYSAINNSFIVSIFWQHMGIILYGSILLLSQKRLWNKFIQSIKINGVKMFSLNFFSEGLSSIAFFILNYALLLAPITIIMSLNTYQPAFVFIIGIIITLFFPKLSSEKIRPLHLLHKGIAIVVMIIGTLLISHDL